MLISKLDSAYKMRPKGIYYQVRSSCSWLVDAVPSTASDPKEPWVRITTTFFVGLDQLELASTPTRGDRFFDEYYLTTDQKTISNLVHPYAHAIGNVEARYLTGGGAKALVYRSSSQEVDLEDIGGSLEKLLVEDMLSVKLLQFYLWLVKDNAAHFDRFWIATRTTQGLVVNNNTWGERPSCADGSFKIVRFNKDELKVARSPNFQRPDYITSKENPTMLVGSSLRYERFTYFLDAARSSKDVALKIAQYCSALEAMVSTSQSEISHQVSERVASTLNGPGEERIGLFKLIKEAYGYRSKAIHGATFKTKDADRLRECASELDESCRRLWFVYADPSSGFRDSIEVSDQIATDYFLQRTLGRA